MKNHGAFTRARLAAAGAALALLLPLVAGAQQEESDSEDVGADTTLVPVPAKPAPRAARALMLDVAKAGSTWVAVGQRGNILLSSDGDHWQQVAVPADNMLNRVRFLDATHGWAVGYDGTLLGTADGGKTWTLLQFDATWGRPYFDVLFFDESNGLLAGANGVLKKTGDGGKTWSEVSSDVFADTPNLYNLVALGNGTLLLAGERGFLATSKDKGATWTQLKSPYTGSYFGALAQGAGGALIFGLRGNAFYAADIAKAAPLTKKDLEQMRKEAADPENARGAKNPVSEVAGWKHLANTDTEPLFGGAAMADGRVFLVGQNGRVMKVDLAAGALVRVPVATDVNMNAALPAGDGLITVGTSGVIKVAVQ